MIVAPLTVSGEAFVDLAKRPPSASVNWPLTLSAAAACPSVPALTVNASLIIVVPASVNIAVALLMFSL